MAVCPNCGEDNPERAKFCLECATPLRFQPALPQEARKTVTVLFCDLAGSTALGERLDSESLREVMDRYFAEMKRIVERHGGIVEKYIGDAVMAVFGLPRAHEDDALRAVRAAFEMGQSLATLNSELDRYWGVALANRIGVTTGEVVVGDASSGQRLATGDTVNVAARLEQAALAGTVLVGEPTYRLVRDAVEVEVVEPLALKGKSERLPAFCLIEVKRGAEGIARRLDAPIVGRASEVAALMEAFQRVIRDDSCHLGAVLGEAGVGKSRLVAEVAGTLKDATILRGRCLSYGEGITFWPIAEMVRNAAGISEQDSVTAARQKIAGLVEDDMEIAERVQALIGLSEGSFAIEESFWAVRQLLERLAQQRPLFVVIEDIHWAEPTLLDLLGSVVELSRRAPILLVCTARKEEFEGGSDWLGKLSDATVLVLHPLTAADSEALIHSVLGSRGLDAGARDRIIQAAQGNPLFVEQILSMWLDDGTLVDQAGVWILSGSMSSVVVPPTISALLSERLDRLDQNERTVIAGASVVGQVFYRGAVQNLCPIELARRVPIEIGALVSKEFIRPDQTTFLNDEAYAFRHVLIRNAAYEAMLKRTRVTLHERFATWLESVTGDRLPEYEEIVGYHLEQAYAHHVALGVLDNEARSLAGRAARCLASAGTRAMARSDIASAASLLDRAVDLALDEADQFRFEVMLSLGIALARTGNSTRAEQVFASVVDGSGDPSMRLHARIERASVHIAQASPQGLAEAHDLAEASISAFEQLGDASGIAKAWRLLATVSWIKAQFDPGIEALRRALDYTRGHDRFQEMQITSELIMAMAFGPTPVQEVIREGERMLEQVEDRVVRATLLSTLRLMYAWLGHFDHARDLGQRAATICRDLGQHVLLGWWSEEAALVEIAAGNLNLAEKKLRRGCDALTEMGEKAALSTKAAILADVIFAQGRYEEADQYATLSERAAAPDDIASQARWRSVRSKIMATRGNSDESVRLAQEAAALVDTSDDLDLRGEVWLCCAETQRLVGQMSEAAESAKVSLALYEQKGSIVSATRARTFIEELLRAATSEMKLPSP